MGGSFMKSRMLGLATFVASVFALLAAARAAEPNWPPSLTIATASPGGTYHAYGQGLARLLTRVLDIPVAELITEGPRDNIRHIESGGAQIAFVTMGVALQAWNGTADWTEGREFRAMRAMFPMYDTPFTFAVAKASAIRTFADMNGKRIGVGPKGGTAGTYVPQILAALKIDAALAFGSYDDLAAQLRDGKIDVLAAAAGAPFPALAALDAEKRVRFIPLSRDDTVALRLAMPELTPATIPAGLYPSMMTDYQTVGLYNFAVVNKNLPSDLVYAIVDAVFTNRDELVAAHPAAAATVPANYSHNTFLPYHPGAMQYYSRLAATGAMPSD